MVQTAQSKHIKISFPAAKVRVCCYPFLNRPCFAIKGIPDVTSAIDGMTLLIAVSFQASLIQTMIASLKLEGY